jgi:signal transduction histidine kinase
LREEQRARLADLSASRARLLETTQRVRRATATRLSDEVRAPLRAAGLSVARVRSELDEPAGEAADALDIVLGELAAVDREIDALVAGVPPADLGAGRVRGAVEALARLSPVPVTFTADPAAAAGATEEAVLFYVCSEALTNAAKHAGASRVLITLARRDDVVEARIADDGRGGADPDGSGLRGLGDRVAACGGRLRVESPLGAGTVVTAVVPARA